MNIYAVVDIGTLKVKTEIASINADGTLNRIYSSNNLTCFGVGIDENEGNIQEKYLNETIKELLRVRDVIKSYNVDSFKVVSTHALRRAKNREYVHEKMQKLSGLHIENISQEEEARLFFNAVIRTFNNREQEYVVVDVGGGSVQVLLGSRDNLRVSHLMPTGAQVLHEEFVKNPHEATSFSSEKDLEQMRQKIVSELVGLESGKSIPLVYGSSIIIDVMKGINLYLEPHDGSATHPYKTYSKYLSEFIQQITPLTFQQRDKRYKNVQQGFMWGIDKGFLNILAISQHFSSPYIIPSNANIAQGIIYSMSN